MALEIQTKPEPVPGLPVDPGPMTWREVRAHGDDRGPEFYATCLAYAQRLWLDREAPRAILALDRALFSAVPADASILETYPLPYAAIAYILEHHDRSRFLGNPRVSYQHLATRPRGTRAELNCARAWACWAISRAVLPELPADLRQVDIIEPDIPTLLANLDKLGHPGESEQVRRLLAEG